MYELRKKTARKIVAWNPEGETRVLLVPRISLHAAIFFSRVFFRVTHDGLSEKGTTRSLRGDCIDKVTVMWHPTILISWLLPSVYHHELASEQAHICNYDSGVFTCKWSIQEHIPLIWDFDIFHKRMSSPVPVEQTQLSASAHDHALIFHRNLRSEAGWQDVGSNSTITKI